jgi:hypothetical protein
LIPACDRYLPLRPLRLESLPPFAPRPTPGTRTLARSAFGTAFAAHVALGLGLFVAGPERPADTFTAPMVLRMIEPSDDWVCTLPAKPSPPMAPSSAVRGEMTIDYILETPVLPGISELSPPPALDPADFGDFTLPVEPDVSKPSEPVAKSPPRAARPPPPRDSLPCHRRLAPLNPTTDLPHSRHPPSTLRHRPNPSHGERGGPRHRQRTHPHLRPSRPRRGRSQGNRALEVPPRPHRRRHPDGQPRCRPHCLHSPLSLPMGAKAIVIASAWPILRTKKRQ